MRSFLLSCHRATKVQFVVDSSTNTHRHNSYLVRIGYCDGSSDIWHLARQQQQQETLYYPSSSSSFFSILSRMDDYSSSTPSLFFTHVFFSRFSLTWHHGRRRRRLLHRKEEFQSNKHSDTELRHCDPLSYRLNLILLLLSLLIKGRRDSRSLVRGLECHAARGYTIPFRSHLRLLLLMATSGGGGETLLQQQKRQEDCLRVFDCLARRRKNLLCRNNVQYRVTGRPTKGPVATY